MKYLVCLMKDNNFYVLEEDRKEDPEILRTVEFEFESKEDAEKAREAFYIARGAVNSGIINGEKSAERLQSIFTESTEDIESSASTSNVIVGIEANVATKLLKEFLYWMGFNK